MSSTSSRDGAPTQYTIGVGKAFQLRDDDGHYYGTIIAREGTCLFYQASLSPERPLELPHRTSELLELLRSTIDQNVHTRLALNNDLARAWSCTVETACRKIHFLQELRATRREALREPKVSDAELLHIFIWPTEHPHLMTGATVALLGVINDEGMLEVITDFEQCDRTAKLKIPEQPPVYSLVPIGTYRGRGVVLVQCRLTHEFCRAHQSEGSLVLKPDCTATDANIKACCNAIISWPKYGPGNE